MNLKKLLQKRLYRFPALFDKAQSSQIEKEVQVKEQYFLQNMIDFKKVRSIVQVGANDGIRKDPVRKWIVNRNVSAVLVEPDPDAFKELKRAYRYLIKKGKDIHLINKACTPEENDVLKFYTLSTNARQNLKLSDRLKLTRKASLSKEIFYSFLLKKGYKNTSEMIAEHKVETVTLFSLFQEFGKPDLLVLDTEGFDWDLLDHLIQYDSLPFAILFERGTPASETKRKIFRELSVRDYYIYDDWENNIGAVSMIHDQKMTT